MILNQQIEGFWGLFVILTGIIFNVGMFYSIPDVSSPKIDNQLEILRADIEVYKTLRKDNSAPKSLEDLTKPILEFESKDGAFHNPVLDLERVYMKKDDDGNICSLFGGKPFVYEIALDGSGTISYANGFRHHSINFK